MMVFSPRPAAPESNPPTRPAPNRTARSLEPTRSSSSRLSGAQRRLIQSASARLTRMAVKSSRTLGASSRGASASELTTTPRTAQGAPLRMALHSTGTRLRTMVRVAAPMPTLWMANVNRRACGAGTASTFVITGKAMAPPPSDVPPPTSEPNTMVSETCQWLATAWRARSPPRTNQTTKTVAPSARLVPAIRQRAGRAAAGAGVRSSSDGMAVALTGTIVAGPEAWSAVAATWPRLVRLRDVRTG